MFRMGIRNNNGFRHFVHRQLRSRIEVSNTFNFFIEKLNAVGVFITERENVDNTSAHGVLSRFIYVVYFFKLKFNKNFINEIHGIRLSHINAECVFFELVMGDYFFEKRFRVGDNDVVFSILLKFVQHLCANSNICILSGFNIVRKSRCARKKENRSFFLFLFICSNFKNRF